APPRPRPPPTAPPSPYTTLFRSVRLLDAQRMCAIGRPADHRKRVRNDARAGPKAVEQLRLQPVDERGQEIDGYHRGLREIFVQRSEEHTSELQSRENLVCRLLLE